MRLVGAELFHTDRHDEANNRFSQFFANASKKVRVYPSVQRRTGMEGRIEINLHTNAKDDALDEDRLV